MPLLIAVFKNPLRASYSDDCQPNPKKKRKQLRTSILDCYLDIFHILAPPSVNQLHTLRNILHLVTLMLFVVKHNDISTIL